MVTASLKLISKFQDEDFEVGEVVDAFTSITSDGTNRIMILASADKGGLHTKFYNTLLDFSEDWKIYEEPKEPLIKDPKIRKAVKAWAEALNVDEIRFDRFCEGFSFGDGNMYSSINFDGCVFDLADGKEYTITELCGSEQ